MINIFSLEKGVRYSTSFIHHTFRREWLVYYNYRLDNIFYLILEKGISPRTQVLLMACRRNNKTEKRKRNREYARKFQTKVYHSDFKLIL